MATGGRTSPARCLFSDAVNSPSQAVSQKVSHELKQVSLGDSSRFQQRYEFDLLAMQPLSSTPNLPVVKRDSILATDAMARDVHSRWSWETLDPSQQYVPRFYRRKTYPASVVSSRNSSVENIPPTPVKPTAHNAPPPPREGKKRLPSGWDRNQTPKMWTPHSHQTSLLTYFSRIRRPATVTVNSCNAGKDQPIPSEPEGPPVAAASTTGQLCKPLAVTAVAPAHRGRSTSLPSHPSIKSNVTSVLSARELSQTRLAR
uniref:Uncharacterized protein n=1 Tax=Schistocephalus solidus TaxID=70667 RepID=A0A0X3PF68_SCHSO